MPRETGAICGTGLTPDCALFVADLGQSVFSIGVVAGTEALPGAEAVAGADAAATVRSTVTGAFFAMDCVFDVSVGIPVRCAVVRLGCARLAAAARVPAFAPER